MKQHGFLDGYMDRWKKCYVKLEDGFLTRYDKKSLVGTGKNKVRREYFVVRPSNAGVSPRVVIPVISAVPCGSSAYRR